VTSSVVVLDLDIKNPKRGENGVEEFFYINFYLGLSDDLGVYFTACWGKLMQEGTAEVNTIL